MGFDYDKAMSETYNTPIYPHTPLAPILVSPIVKGLNYLADKGVISHIEDQPGAYQLPSMKDEEVYRKALYDSVMAQKTETMTLILRLIPMVLLSVAMWLIFKLLYKKVSINAMLFAIPIVAFRSALSGTYLFYWDAFMMFFFVLTLYLMETQPNGKWQYLTACCMINTKMFIPMLFLIPLIVKGFTQSKKNGLLMFLPAFSILPYYFTTVHVTGDLFYPFTHYLTTVWVHNDMYTLFNPLKYPDLGFIVFVILTIPILYLYKKYPVYATFWLVAMLYGCGTGLGVTHLSCLVYAGALALPLIAGRFHLLERFFGYEDAREIT
jgi:hypothetical protein